MSAKLKEYIKYLDRALRETDPLSPQEHESPRHRRRRYVIVSPLLYL